MQAPACLRCTPLRRYRGRVLQGSVSTWRAFHNTGARPDEFPNHYDTLNLSPNATDKEIKKQFYALSKSNHPDLHPDDPNASKRFMKISEAYATLSSTEKRTVYDRDYNRSFQSSAASGHAYPSGSFSSASTPAGGRPASGLSRRRTQFKGPPPSFYRSGGWGDQAAKRSEHASKPSHNWESQSSAEGAANMPGTGPGGFTHGFQNDVPHFDSEGHFQTHSTIERTRHKARRRVQREPESDGSGGGMVFGFIMISGILGFAVLISGAVGSEQVPRKCGERNEKS